MAEVWTERTLFSGNASFFFAAAHPGAPLPPANRPEFVFAGRSNVGKSSLINAVTGQKKLARASGTPGCTGQLNFFNVRDAVTVTDIPGYGYAKKSGAERERWADLIEDYFIRRGPDVTLLYILIDARRGVKELDEALASYANDSATRFRCILTKIDKTKKSERDAALLSAQGLCSRYGAAYEDVFLTSTKDNEGIRALRHEIINAANAPKRQYTE